jgi:PAS domain S-box-containing protein
LKRNLASVVRGYLIAMMFISHKLCEIFGMDRDEIHNPSMKFFLTLVHPDDRDLVQTQLRDMLAAHHDRLDLECRVRHKQGHYFWARIKGRMVSKKPNDGPSRVIGVAADITATKERETVLRKVIEEKQNTLNMVSHDLRSPLSAIKISASIVSNAHHQGVDRRSSKRHVEMILRAVDRISDLTEDLLRASQIEAGTFTISPTTAYIDEIVDDALLTIFPLAIPHSITIDNRVSRAISPIWCDRGRLIQVFTNLVGNAIKYSERNTTITLSSEVERGFVCISVADQGYGIPEEQIPFIFERYWKGDSTAGRSPMSIGLGLYISRAIVEAHGGKIWVESTPGGGSTFKFTIPLVE